jgi:hypothetical protein
MSESLLQRILRYVEWSKPTLHTTGKGKSKLIATGIPSQHFWKHWKLHKEELRTLGISLKFYASGREQRKQWEVIAWQPEIINH